MSSDLENSMHLSLNPLFGKFAIKNIFFKVRIMEIAIKNGKGISEVRKIKILKTDFELFCTL